MDPLRPRAMARPDDLSDIAHPTLDRTLEVMLNMRTALDIQRAIKLGAVCAVGWVLLSFVCVFASPPADTQVAIRPLICAILALLMVFGIVRHSRVGATCLLIIFGAGQIAHWVAGTLPAVALVALSVGGAFIFARALQATLVAHRMARRFEAWQKTMSSAMDPRLFEDS